MGGAFLPAILGPVMAGIGSAGSFTVLMAVTAIIGFIMLRVQRSSI
jgi:hypothetical protein